MITINEYLDIVLADFKEYVNSQDRLCSLRDVHFDAGKVPDYSKKNVQLLYLLRYAYAYAFEYKCIYRSLLNRMHYDESIKVTSIGCGTGIDYWSLAHIVKDNCKICYRGIDTVDWNNKMIPRPKDDFSITQGNAIDLFNDSGRFSSDVYVFPKSISEFSNKDVNSLIGNFTKETVAKDVFHFIFTLRTDWANQESDMAKTFAVFNHMRKCGFRSNDDPAKTYKIVNSYREKKIQELDGDFSHPWSVYDYLNELSCRCSDHSSCERNKECEERLTRKPIISCKYALGQIFTFER